MNKRLKKDIIFILFVLVLFVGVLVNFNRIGSFLGLILQVISPLLVGLAIAFVVNILYSFIRKLFSHFRFGRGKAGKYISLALSYLLLFGFVAAVILFLIPQLGESVNRLYMNLDNYLAQLDSFVRDLVSKIDFSKIDFTQIDADMINSYIKSFFNGGVSVVQTLFPHLVGFATGTVRGVVNLVMSFIVSVYVLSDKEHLLRQANDLLAACLPEKVLNKVLHVGRVSGRTFTLFIKGQVTEALVLGSLCFIGMVIFRFDYALLISVIIGVTSLIPILGAIIGCVPAVFILLMINPVKAFWFIVFIIILQQVEGDLIYPRVVGSKMGLPALWVFAGVMIGGGLGGVLGMLLGVPVMAIIYQLTSEFVRNRKEKKNVLQTEK
ncbi:AI-2E family transporter [Anaerolentibacter hominis]|uniref:AI-2E family transporter n=1 Tax=Anaerolentibacter hominis TaxID=3079009 RepID=UPI0031B8AEDD